MLARFCTPTKYPNLLLEMDPFDESSVLIPSATLEDFPADASDADARSLLAGWTVLWHPELIAATEQLPTWFRADSPPEPDGPRIVVVPSSSMAQLPSGFEQKCQNNKDCRWIVGADRAEMLQQLSQQIGLSLDVPVLHTEHRSIGVEDFFAAAYASLQVQIMTRRLRYTSNLDEIHLQKEIVSAAKSYLAGDASAAASALHNVFDCLSEERDHYFSSDPHLIDLTLLTPNTLDTLVQGDTLAGGNEKESINRLATPQNVLIDAAVAQSLQAESTRRYDSFLDRLRNEQVGWIGGSPPQDVCFDAMTFADAEQVLRDGFDLAAQAVGTPPKVYGRFSGSTPADLTPLIVGLGYIGIVPIDFAHGSGFGEEAKVMQRSGGVEIESLTAKPVDAASDSGFLNIGAKLGEAIDSGEIATGLFAHWPGQGCASFDDLRRVASWCLALGRFWKLHEYFADGEHPYHHASTRSVSADAHNVLTSQVAAGKTDPLSSQAAATREAVSQEAGSLLVGMGDLVSGKTTVQPDKSRLGLTEAASRFAVASGAELASGGGDDALADAVMIVNPLGVSQRVAVAVKQGVDKRPDHIFSVDRSPNASQVSVDVVGGGFATVQGSAESTPKGSFFQRLIRPKSIANDKSLQNEFMEVAICEHTGGVAGVYSGSTRGNRFSLRLVYVNGKLPKGDAGKPPEDGSRMKCQRVAVVQSTLSLGKIQATGEVVDRDDNLIGTFDLTYTLHRGSRFLELSGTFQLSESDDLPFGSTQAKSDPWNHYLAIRVAVASESSIARVFIRDKLHRARSRRLVAPLGVVMDEAERQTLIASQGAAYHRRVGDRFLDTLVSVAGETSNGIEMRFGFDCPNPIGHAKAAICPPIQLNVLKNDGLPAVGWITHTTPSSAMLTRLNVMERSDGKLAALVRVIQTRSQSANGVVRFCRDVEFAATVARGDQEEINQEVPAINDESSKANATGLKWKGDAVKFPLAGHQVFDFLVVFKAS